MTEDLLSYTSLHQRVNHVVDKYLASLDIFTHTTREDLRQAAEAFFNKLDIADRYSPERKLRSSVTLVKSSHTSKEPLHSLAEDFGLSEVGKLRKHVKKGAKNISLLLLY